jgi:hypothetical protein
VDPAVDSRGCKALSSRAACTTSIHPTTSLMCCSVSVSTRHQKSTNSPRECGSNSSRPTRCAPTYITPPFRTITPLADRLLTSAPATVADHVDPFYFASSCSFRLLQSRNVRNEGPATRPSFVGGCAQDQAANAWTTGNIRQSDLSCF